MKTQVEIMNDISIAITQQDAASRTLAVTVPVERVQAAEAEAVRWYGRSAKVPGFRKGHVPAPVVRKRFGEAIRQSALEQLLRESWSKALDEQALKPVGEPRVRVTKFEDGAPLTFEIAVDVRPELALERLGGFTLKRQVAVVTDAALEAQLLALREQRAPWAPAEGRARPGDLIEASIQNLDSGEEAGEPVRFVIGEGRALPELESRIMELDPGATWEGHVRFPDDHPEEAKRGQSRQLRVTLLEVKRQQVPELTDEFAREVGDFADAAALRVAVRADLEAEAGREADSRLRAELIDQIAAANNVSVPPSLLERALHAYAHAYGLPEDQHGRFAGEFRPVAEAQVRRDLIIENLAEREKLHATEEEIEVRIAEVAARRSQPPAVVRAALDKAGRLRELERSITDDKVFAHLFGLSTVEGAAPARS
jgi:trigger factor